MTACSRLLELYLIHVTTSDALDEQSKGETREGVNDPLTEGDLQSHRILVKGFKKAFPALNLVRLEFTCCFSWEIYVSYYSALFFQNFDINLKALNTTPLP